MTDYEALWFGDQFIKDALAGKVSTPFSRTGDLEDDYLSSADFDRPLFIDTPPAQAPRDPLAFLHAVAKRHTTQDPDPGNIVQLDQFRDRRSPS